MDDNSNILHADHTTEAAVGAALALEIGKPRTVTLRNPREIAYVLVPQAEGGCKIETFEHKETPDRMTGVFQLDDEASYVAFVDAHKILAVSAHYARQCQFGASAPGPYRVVCVIDEHEKDGGPGWRDFRAVMEPRWSESFNRWMGQNGKKFAGNEEFAEFLEDGFMEIIDPSGATMLELASNFHVKQEVAFGNPINLQDGSQKLSFTRAVAGSSTTGGSVVIPKKFTIEIPLVRSDDTKYQFEAHLRFRLLDGGKLVIWYDFIRPDLVLDRAFEDAVSAIAMATTLPVYKGAADFSL